MNDYQPSPFDTDEFETLNRPKSSPFTIAMVVFFSILLLALTVMGTIFFLRRGELKPNNEVVSAPTFPTPTTSADSVHSLPLSSYEDRMAVAVYVMDNEAVLQTVSLVMFHADTTGPKVTTVGLPSETDISTDDSAVVTIGELFDRDVEEAQDGLNAFFADRDEISVKYYMIFTYDQIETLVATIRDRGDSFFFTLDEAIGQQPNDGGSYIQLPAGTLSLHPNQVGYLFRYTEWPRGNQERADMHADVIAAFLNQFISGATDVDLTNTQALLYSTSHLCTFGAEDHVAYASMLKDIAGYTDTVMCDTLKTQGAFESNGTVFRLDGDTAKVIRANLY
ncbi:MAG: hypothetical protein IKV35_03590 [Clostridia bacterium]|nr:hypothetical protein [Clostridia bacterium]